MARRNFKTELDHAMPTMRGMKFGSHYESVVAQLNATSADLQALRTAFNVLAAKLNADAGVTDTNYAVDAALTEAAAPIIVPSAIVSDLA